MRVIKTEKQTIEQDVVIADYMVCDKCLGNIELKRHDAFESNVKLTTGSSYPEGGEGGEKWLDLCQPCAEVLMDKLKALGYKVQSREFDW